MTCRHCGRAPALLDVTVPAHLSATGEAHPKRVEVDACIAGKVAALNALGLLTAGSCCGHADGPASIVFHDGEVRFEGQQPREEG